MTIHGASVDCLQGSGERDGGGRFTEDSLLLSQVLLRAPSRGIFDDMTRSTRGATRPNGQMTVNDTGDLEAANLRRTLHINGLVFSLTQGPGNRVVTGGLHAMNRRAKLALPFTDQGLVPTGHTDTKSTATSRRKHVIDACNLFVQFKADRLDAAHALRAINVTTNLQRRLRASSQDLQLCKHVRSDFGIQSEFPHSKYVGTITHHLRKFASRRCLDDRYITGDACRGAVCCQ